MANELRVFANHIAGLVEDNPLLAAATTLTSAGLSSAPAIGTTNHMIVVFDPDGLTGAAFAKRITAHTASATTATIAATAFYGTARDIPRDTPWVHALIAEDIDVATEVSAIVATSESTTSMTMVDLTTAGPAVTYTVPASGVVYVTLSAFITCGTGASGWMGVALSGANTAAANQTTAVACGLSIRMKASSVQRLSGLTPGVTTFTAKYRVDDAAVSTSFSQRAIGVRGGY